MVIAIIGILAALLLPVLGQAGIRARRIQCVDYLRQQGVAFHGFAHDHNSKFPMAVSTNSGGALEYAQVASRLNGDFYLAYTFFLPLASDLVTPKVLVCPADTRPVATNFNSFRNTNLSYFVAITADFAQPGSILAGDRNVTNDWVPGGSISQLGPNSTLRWTSEMHRFKGNLLLSDGSVQEPNNAALASPRGQGSTTTTMAVPTPDPGGSTDGGSGGNNGGGGPGAGGSASPTRDSGRSPTLPLVHLDRTAATNKTTEPWAGPPDLAGTPSGDNGGKRPLAFVSAADAGSSATPKSHSVTNGNSGGGGVGSGPSEAEEPNQNPFIAWFADMTVGLTKKAVWWFYLILLLLVAIALWIRRQAHGRKKGGRKPTNWPD